MIYYLAHDLFGIWLNHKTEQQVGHIIQQLQEAVQMAPFMLA